MEATRLRPCRDLRRFPLDPAPRFPSGVRGRIRRLHNRMCTLASRQHRTRKGRKRELRVGNAHSTRMRQNAHPILFLDSMRQEQDRRRLTHNRSARAPLSQHPTCPGPEQERPRTILDLYPLRKHIHRGGITPSPTASTIHRQNRKERRKGMWHPHACLVKRHISGSSSQF